MAVLKIKQMDPKGRTIVGTRIEIDGVPCPNVKSLQLSMDCDSLNVLKIVQAVTPDVTIAACDVDITKVCRCCGHRLDPPPAPADPCAGCQCPDCGEPACPTPCPGLHVACRNPVQNCEIARL